MHPQKEATRQGAGVESLPRHCAEEEQQLLR